MLILPRVKRFVDGKMGRKDGGSSQARYRGRKVYFMTAISFKVQN